MRLDNALTTAFEQQLARDLQRVALLVDKAAVVVDCHSVGLFNLVDKNVAWAKNLFQENSWNGHVGFSNAHLDLQFINNIIGDVDNPLKHGNLFLIANDTHLSAFQEKVRRVPGVNIKVNLGPDLLEQNEIAFENELHLDLVE
jgi:hypothetical protein